MRPKQLLTDQTSFEYLIDVDAPLIGSAWLENQICLDEPDAVIDLAGNVGLVFDTFGEAGNHSLT